MLDGWPVDDVWKGLTLLIGTGVGIVAYQQFRLAQEKFKLDLFEKRFSVFAAARRLLTVILSGANVTPHHLFEYRPAVAEATFLFGQDITDYLGD